jgi:hypothetical protein
MIYGNLYQVNGNITLFNMNNMNKIFIFYGDLKEVVLCKSIFINIISLRKKEFVYQKIYQLVVVENGLLKGK